MKRADEDSRRASDSDTLHADAAERAAAEHDAAEQNAAEQNAAEQNAAERNAAEEKPVARRPRGWRRSRVVLLGGLIAVVIVAAVVVVRHGHGSPAPAAAPHGDPTIAGTPVTVGTDVCGAGWTGGTAGAHTFAFWNNSIEVLEVYVEDVRSHKVFLDAENIGSGATRAFTVDLGPGRYHFYCMPSESDPVKGATWSLTGRASGRLTPGIVPITVRDLIPPLGKYDDWVRGQLPSLQTRVGLIADDVRRGDRPAAEQDWILAHHQYQTLGAAYDAFGHDGDAIDGTPPAGDTPAEAAADKHLAGFHKIEAQLWSGTPIEDIQAPADALVTAVGHLRKDMVNPVQSTTVVGLRSHEIIEDAITFSLTGADDFGSHSDLSTIDANLTGSLEALRPLRPLLASRGHDMTDTDAAIARTQRLVRSFHHGQSWTPLQRLSRAEHEQLVSDLDRTAELLSEVAVITEPRRSN